MTTVASQQLGWWSLPNDRRTPRRARQLVLDVLGEVDGDTRDIVALLVSEVVANAVVHGAGPVHVTVDVEAHVFRVSVHDTGPGMPRAAAAPTSHEQGRGLAIVRALAEDWGYHPGGAQPSGKTVWFTVSAGATGG